MTFPALDPEAQGTKLFSPHVLGATHICVLAIAQTGIGSQDWQLHIARQSDVVKVFGKFNFIRFHIFDNIHFVLDCRGCARSCLLRAYLRVLKKCKSTVG